MRLHLPHLPPSLSSGRGSESPAPSFNLDPNSGSFMRANSMKAWKVDHDRQLAEEARKNQEKEKKAGRALDHDLHLPRR